MSGSHTSGSDIHLDDQTYTRVKQLAELRNMPIEAVIHEAVDRYCLLSGQPILPAMEVGAMEDCIAFMDDLVSEAYRQREQLPPRLPLE